MEFNYSKIKLNIFTKYREEKAQTLIEIIVAIGILAIVFAGSWQILNVSYLSVVKQYQGMKAHYLVIEGLEQIRSIRDESWTSLVDGVWHADFVVIDPDNSALVLGSGTQTIDSTFRRDIFIQSVHRNDSTGKISTDVADPVDPLSKLIEVKVEWDLKGVTYSDSESIYLSNWNRF